MSDSLRFVNEKLNQFRRGEIDLAQVWEAINSKLEKPAQEPTEVDRYDDDKAEPRTTRPMNRRLALAS